MASKSGPSNLKVGGVVALVESEEEEPILFAQVQADRLGVVDADPVSVGRMSIGLDVVEMKSTSSGLG